MYIYIHTCDALGLSRSYPMAFAQKLAYLYPRLSEHIGELKNPQEACLHVYSLSDVCNTFCMILDLYIYIYTCTTPTHIYVTYMYIHIDIPCASPY